MFKTKAIDKCWFIYGAVLECWGFQLSQDTVKKNFNYCIVVSREALFSQQVNVVKFSPINVDNFFLTNTYNYLAYTGSLAIKQL